MYTNEITQWEGDTTQALTTYTWKSRKYILPRQITFNAFRIIFTPGDLDDYWALVQAYQEAEKRNKRLLAEGKLFDNREGFLIHEYVMAGDALEELPDNPSYSGDSSLTFTLYADGTSVFSKDVYDSGIYKISTGYRSRIWEFTLEGNVAVQRVDLASSVAALKYEETAAGG